MQTEEEKKRKDSQKNQIRQDIEYAVWQALKLIPMKIPAFTESKGARIWQEEREGGGEFFKEWPFPPSCLVMDLKSILHRSSTLF